MDRKEQMQARSRRAKENRDKRFGGKAKYSVLNLDAMCKDFGWEEVPWYQVSAGATKNEIDIIIWIVTQKWYPKLRSYDGTPLGLDVGSWDYKLEIPVHQRWGGQNSTPLFCRNEGIGERCPICEDRQAEWDKGKGVSDKEILKALNASWRCFYNIYDYSKDAYVPWEAAYKTFEEMLQEEIDIKEKDEGKEIIPWDLDNGFTLEFKGKTKQIGETEYNEPQIPDFGARDPYDEGILQKMIPFDKYLTIPSYDEVCRIYYGVDDDSKESEDTAPATKPSEDGTTRRRRPADEGPKDEPAPPSERRRRREHQQTEKTDTPNDTRCPFNHNFGIDCNEKPECSNECEEKDFDACISEQDRLIAEKKEKPAETTTRSRKESSGSDDTPPAETTTRRRRRA